jgi:hypothetical protein
MSLGKAPVFRKIITPWYDSDIACYIVIASMIGIIVFGIAGVSVALENQEYRDYLWLPIFLIFLCAVVTLSSTLRIIRRYE